MGLKLLFALLCRPDMVNVGVREIAKFAGVAHGTVGGVLADLRNLGFVVETGNQRTRVRKLRNRHKLLMQWLPPWCQLNSLKPSLGSLLTGNLLPRCRHW